MMRLRPGYLSRTLLLACCTLAAIGLQVSAAAAAPIPDQYIVTVREGHDPREVAASVDATPRHIYTAALNGFAARLSQDQLEALRRHPSVELIEQDQEVSGRVTQWMDAAGDPWGLDRIDQKALALSGTYTYNGTGTGVRAYILDTGLQADHSQFGNRALNVFNATSGGPADCHGHGTHVAGTVGARTFGVAKNVYLRGVKVLGADCSKNGTWADVIEGVDWVMANHIKPAVANMSLGGDKLIAVNTAVNNLAAAGVFVSVAAGNDNVDACTQSPAGALNAYTTASSMKTNAKSGFSNWGSCVDGYAPGTSIKSSTLGGGSGWMSGTSMASPHVAGTAALLCGLPAGICSGPGASPTITNWINTQATVGAITGNQPGTPNRLLFKAGL